MNTQNFNIFSSLVTKSNDFLENQNARTIDNAFYGEVMPLRAKTAAIWESSIIYIFQIGKEKSTEIKKAYKSLNLEDKKIENNRKILLHSSINRDLVFYNANPVARSYLGMLFQMREIRDKFYACTNSSVRYQDIFSEDFKKQIFSEIKPENSIVIDNIIPRFFILQLCCHEAKKIIDTPKGVSINDAKKIERAKQGQAARAAKNYKFGEFVLRKKIEEFLLSKYPNKYKNLRDLSDKNEENLEKILKEYQARIGDCFESFGPLIEFGEKLVIHDLYDLMSTWKRKHSDFKDALERVLEHKTLS